MPKQQKIDETIVFYLSCEDLFFIVSYLGYSSVLYQDKL